MEEMITVIVHDLTGREVDVQIPLNITAASLIRALHEGLRHAGACPAAIRAENPVAYLTGERELWLYGLRNGTSLYFFKG